MRRHCPDCHAGFAGLVVALVLWVGVAGCCRRRLGERCPSRRRRICGLSMRPTWSNWPSGARPTGWPTRPGRPATFSGPAIRTSSICRCCPTRSARRSCRPMRRPKSWSGIRGWASCGAIRPRRFTRWRSAPCEPARPGLAFDLAMAAIQANPDYEPVRRLLGYQKFRDQWRTLYEAKKLRDGQRLERQVRLAAEGLSPPLRGRAALLRRPLDLGRRRRRAASRHPAPAGTSRPSTTRSARTTASRRRGAGREARTAVPPLAADVRPLLRLGGRRGGAVRRPRQSSAAVRAAQGDLLPRPRRLQSLACGRWSRDIDITIGMYFDRPRRGVLLRRQGQRRPQHCTTRPRTSCSTNRGRWRPTWAGRPTSGSSRGSPCTWNRFGRKTATTCWAASTTMRMHAAQYRLLATTTFYVPLEEFAGYGHGEAPERPADRHALQPGGRPDPLPGLSTTAAAIATRWLPICRPSTRAAISPTRWPS